MSKPADTTNFYSAGDYSPTIASLWSSDAALTELRGFIPRFLRGPLCNFECDPSVPGDSGRHSCGVRITATYCLQNGIQLLGWGASRTSALVQSGTRVRPALVVSWSGPKSCVDARPMPTRQWPSFHSKAPSIGQTRSHHRLDSLEQTAQPTVTRIQWAVETVLCRGAVENSRGDESAAHFPRPCSASLQCGRTRS